MTGNNELKGVEVVTGARFMKSRLNAVLLWRFSMKFYLVLLTASLCRLNVNPTQVLADDALPEVAQRFIITVNRIDPKEKEGVVLKNSAATLRIVGPVSGIMSAGDTLHVKVKGATISGLTFTEPCELKIAKDKTLLATRENVVAKDSKGKLWKSRAGRLDNEDVFVFVAEPDAGKSNSTTSPRRATSELNAAVVGIEGSISLYVDADLKRQDTQLNTGAGLTVVAEQEDVLRVRASTGQEGWLRRCWVCSSAEMDRRKAKSEVPKNCVCIKAEGDNKLLYGGSLSIENGSVVVRAGDAFWLDPTMKGKDFSIAGQKVVGDPSVLLLKKEGAGSILVKLPIWSIKPDAKSDKDLGTDSHDTFGKLATPSRMSVYSETVPTDQVGQYSLTTLLRVPDHTGPAAPQTMALSRTGEYVAFVEQGTVVLVSPKEPSQIVAIFGPGTKQGDEKAQQVAFHPSLDVLGIATDQGAYLFAGPKWTVVYRSPHHGIEGILFPPAYPGYLLVKTTGNDSVEPILVAKTQIPAPSDMLVLERMCKATKIGFQITNEDATMVFKAPAPQAAVAVFDYASLQVPKSVLATDQATDGLWWYPSLSADGKFCGSCCVIGAPYCAVWNIETSKMIAQITVPSWEQAPIANLQFSANGKWLSASWGTRIGIWHIGAAQRSPP